MPEPGGPSAIYGILYQILANLWRVSEIRLDTKLDGQEIRSACLILEPKGGGGNTRYEGDGIRVVEQYKTRGGKRTWSLNELINRVLPDLFIDVDPARLTEVCTYRFVTDGRCGHIGHFRRFLDNFGLNPAPDDLLDSLDDTKKYRFLGRGTLTERALFLHMAHRVRSKGDKTEDTVHYRKLWHLLAGLKISEMNRPSDLKQKIDEFLIQVVERREEVEAKRQQLCGILIERAAQGSYPCTPEEILGSAQLNATPLSELGTLKARLRELAEERFRDRQYDRGRDVRGIPTWPNECSVLVFVGESGQGKTWQLFRLAAIAQVEPGSKMSVHQCRALSYREKSGDNWISDKALLDRV